MPVRITSVECTDLFVGSEGEPRQVLRVGVEGGPAQVSVTGPGVSGSGEGPEIALVTGAPAGTRVPVVVTAGDDRVEATVTVEEPGWTVYLVSHFHYDPVWWNTQAAYTSPWELLWYDATTRPLWERNGFALVDAHLDLALRDPVYRFVLAEIDYLKPYFDVHPERRADLRRLLASGQVELVGGTYNEPNTNLTGAETTIRNIVYGVGYQRDVLGGDPTTAWQLDVFGHDPQFPGYLAAAGLTGSAWARGPFHQWGPIQKNFGRAHDDARVMQFPSEFEWLSPSGHGVLTHYMPHHYSAGWWMDSAADLAAAEQAVYDLYRKLKPVAATRNLLLPVGTDYTPPNKWVTEIHRSWNARYVWPRFVCATPRDFLGAVRAAGVRPGPQSRDMNPVYTGKDVSYIDTKQAQRAGEVAALDAEKLATVAVVSGLGAYPGAALDKVWRHLAYGAHHDAITGSESDQVYIDLLGGWREAYDLATAVRDEALAALLAAADTTGDGLPVVVVNPLSFDRTDLVEVALPAGTGAGRLVDAAGAPVPFAVDEDRLRFLAADVPALGWRTWRLHPGPASPAWTPMDGLTVDNGRYRVTADPGRGGGLTSVLDRRSGRELIRAGAVGHELRVYEEYPTHPDFGEGPWHLVPKGPVVGAATTTATVRAERGPLGQRLVVRGTVDGLAYEQTVTLWHGLDRVDGRTRVVDYRGADRLLRLRFPVDVPGARPVSEVAGAVVGRGFALPDVDAAQAPWTLDNPANTWFGVSSTARVCLRDGSGAPAGERALGVAEVVVPTLDDAPDARDLVVALVRVGVTATTAAAGWARYGWLDVDSNLPDVRIVVGGPEANPAARELFERAGPGYAEAFAAHGRVWVPARRPLAEVWRPNADLRDLRALPALVVADPAALADDLADARITAVCPGEEPEADRLTDHTVALVTTGLPGFAVDPSGALHLSLMRSCTGWPSGVWIDPPRRTLPDGAGFQLQHWTHDFAYALVSGDGDWRALALPSRGQELNHPLHGRVATVHDGRFPGTHSFLRVEPAREVLLSTLKPAGNPIAHGSSTVDGSAVTVRLVEATGLGRRARLGGALALGPLRTADLLERPLDAPTGDPLALPGASVTTLRAEPAGVGDRGGGPLGPSVEAAQPVYARYWLHNRGPAPMGYLPVTVAASPGLVATGGEPVELSIVVASQYVDAVVEGGLTVDGPPGWRVAPARRPYRLEPGGFVRQAVRVEPAPGAAPGTYFVAARIDHGGQRIEDVVTVVLGPGGAAIGGAIGGAVDGAVDGGIDGAVPVPGAVPGIREAIRGTTGGPGRDTGLDIGLSASSVTLAPGGRASLGLRLANRTRGEIRGEAQLVAPWGTWAMLAEPVRGFRVDPGEPAGVAFDVVAPATAEAGSYWALVKVMWFGRCQYTPAVALTVTPR